MSERDDGGPAFPRDHAHDGHNGMTLRDYFIAHAPVEPWPEFDPVMPTKRPPSRWVFEKATDVDPRFSTFREAERHYKCSDDLLVNEAAFEQDEWDCERTLQRRIQWPAYWADQMLRARKNRQQ